MIHLLNFITHVQHCVILNTEFPEGYFQVEFVQKISSRYSGKFSFRYGLTQEEILCWCLLDDPDTMLHYIGISWRKVFWIKTPYSFDFLKARLNKEVTYSSLQIVYNDNYKILVNSYDYCE